MKKDIRINVSMNPLEVVLLVLILMYLFSAAPTPQYIAAMFDNPLGIVLLFVIVMFLFLYCNILLGILFIVVGYKLISSSPTPGAVAVIEYTPIQTALDSDAIILPNGTPVKKGDDVRFQQRGYQRPLLQRTIPMDTQSNLEVAAVKSMVTAQPTTQDYLDTPFKPVLERNHGAAPIREGPH